MIVTDFRAKESAGSLKFVYLPKDMNSHTISLENYIYLNWNLAIRLAVVNHTTLYEMPCYKNAKRTVSTKKHQPQCT